MAKFYHHHHTSKKLQNTSTVFWFDLNNYNGHQMKCYNWEIMDLCMEKWSQKVERIALSLPDRFGERQRTETRTLHQGLLLTSGSQAPMGVKTTHPHCHAPRCSSARGGALGKSGEEPRRSRFFLESLRGLLGPPARTSSGTWAEAPPVTFSFLYW